MNDLKHINQLIGVLMNDRDFLTDKIDSVGPREDLLEELNQINQQIEDLKERAAVLNTEGR